MSHDRQLAAFEAANAARNAEHVKARQEIEAANRVVLSAWESEKTARAPSRNESRCNRPLLLGGLRLRRRWLDRHTRVQLRLDVRRLPMPVPTAVRRHLRLHALHRLHPPARQRRST